MECFLLSFQYFLKLQELAHSEIDYLDLKQRLLRSARCAAQAISAPAAAAGTRSEKS
jgi:hypothetical protein